jgi:hypothetical protein
MVKGMRPPTTPSPKKKEIARRVDALLRKRGRDGGCPNVIIVTATN